MNDITIQCQKCEQSQLNSFNKLSCCDTYLCKYCFEKNIVNGELLTIKCPNCYTSTVIKRVRSIDWCCLYTIFGTIIFVILYGCLLISFIMPSIYYKVMYNKSLFMDHFIFSLVCSAFFSCLDLFLGAIMVSEMIIMCVTREYDLVVSCFDNAGTKSHDNMLGIYYFITILIIPFIKTALAIMANYFDKWWILIIATLFTCITVAVACIIYGFILLFICLKKTQFLCNERYVLENIVEYNKDMRQI